MVVLHVCIFFFLMIRRPPRSTLFPYTNALPILHGRTDLVTPYLASRWLLDRLDLPEEVRGRVRLEVLEGGHMMYLRSEEHTSELQSRQYLVCRLLLEKKKQIRITTILQEQSSCQ